MAKSPQAQETMPEIYSHSVAVRNLADTASNPFELQPDAEALKAIARLLGTRTLRKVRLKGALEPVNKSDWRLVATLGATAVQNCVVTDEPVTTRIDTDVRRFFLGQKAGEDTAPETEFDGDDESEPLDSEIDLGAVLIEALALALPDYPRAEGAELGEAVFSAPGTAPMRDQDTKPFASLAALKDKFNE